MAGTPPWKLRNPRTKATQVTSDGYTKIRLLGLGWEEVGSGVKAPETTAPAETPDAGDTTPAPAPDPAAKEPTKKELDARAKELKIPGRTSLNRDELIAAIAAAEAGD